MCYRVATPKDASEIEGEFHAKVEEYTPYYHLNSFSGESLPVLTTEEPKIVKMIPWKSHESFNSLNARSEEIFNQKKYFKSFNNRRGIIAVSGFFESHEVVKLNKKTGLPLKSTISTPILLN